MSFRFIKKRDYVQNRCKIRRLLFFLSIPLHSREWGSRENLEGKKIHREEAGYRILSLDGGGIRGVFS